MSLPGERVLSTDARKLGCLHHLERVGAEGECRGYDVLRPEVDVPHHDIGKVNRDFIGECPLLEPQRTS